MKTDFEQAWRVSGSFEGWLSRGQAETLWREAAKLPAGSVIVEIGSHRGRSTSVLAAAAPESHVVAVDPFDNPRWGGGAESRDTFLRNLAAAGVENVELLADLSTELRPTWNRAVDLLYIDGAHDYPTVADDLEWAQHVVPGGAVLVHDSFSSLGVTRAVYQRLALRRDLDYVGRSRSLALFQRRRISPQGALKAVGAGGYFVRNVAVKVCLVKGWRRPAALLGQPDMQYPY